MVHSHFSENDIVTCCIYKLAYRQSKCRLPQTFVDFLGCGVEKALLNILSINQLQVSLTILVKTYL